MSKKQASKLMIIVSIIVVFAIFSAASLYVLFSMRGKISQLSISYDDMRWIKDLNTDVYRIRLIYNRFAMSADTGIKITNADRTTAMKILDSLFSKYEINIKEKCMSGKDLYCDLLDQIVGFTRSAYVAFSLNDQAMKATFSQNVKSITGISDLTAELNNCEDDKFKTERKILILNMRITIIVFIIFIVGICFSIWRLVVIIIKYDKIMLGKIRAEQAKARAEEEAAQILIEKNEMEKERLIAEQIQNALLPSEDMQCDGLEISGIVMSAEKVGGDFYNIVEIDGTYYFIIGDVSGHGITAALTQFIAQGAIYTAIKSLPTKDRIPKKILEKSNNIIQKSIKGMGKSNFITIVIFAAWNNQEKCTYAGSHTPCILYKKKENKFYDIKCDDGRTGMWLGILDEKQYSEYVENTCREREFLFKPGDILFGYTDGIIEARHKTTGEMYDTAKLNYTFINSVNNNQTPDEIKQSFIDSLVEYDVDDDVTLLIIEKK